MSLYNNKTQEECRRIFSLNLPKGLAYEASGIEGTNMYYFAKAYGLILANFDQWLSEKIESLKITENSDWLDYYWDKYGIGKYISKPSSASRQVEIIKAFAYARRGLFTLKQFQDFFLAVFGIEIEIELASAASFSFEYEFPLVFYGETDINWTIVVRIKPADILDPGFNNYEFEQLFYEGDTRRDAIIALIEEIVDINFRIVYEDLI